MQTLKMVDVLVAARKFANDKKLGAQEGHTDCFYFYEDDCRCAIGASMNEETRIELQETNANSLSIYTLSQYDESLITIENDDEIDDIKHFQALHDVWCHQKEETNRNQHEATFFSGLERLEEKYGIRCPQPEA